MKKKKKKKNTRGFEKVTHSIKKKKKKIKNKQLPTNVKKKKKFNNLVGHSPWPTCEVLELGGLGYFTKYPSPSSSGTKLG